MSILEAFKGAASEVRDTPGGSLGARIATAARLAGIIARELAGLPGLVPWAAGARLQRARAPMPGHGKAAAVVALARDVPYGPGPRQVADVWVPPGWVDAAGAGAAAGPPTPPAPVAVLVHGGVWSSGDKWTLGPAAAVLASKSGAAVAVPNYTLWPSSSRREGGAAGGLDAGAADVATAMEWVAGGGVEAAVVAGRAATTASPPSAAVGKATRAAAAPPPRPPPRVTLVGHSAGAHLAALAALARSSSGGTATTTTTTPAAAVVTLAGVFDLTAHYEYERGRGVHYLSTMARAAAGAVEWEKEEDDGKGGAAPTPREAAGLAACSPTAILNEGTSKQWAVRPGLLAQAWAAAPARLPGTWLLIAGGADGTVPPSQTRAFAAALGGAGVVKGVRCEVVPGVGHIDFVTGWGRGEGWVDAVAEVVRG